MMAEALPGSVIKAIRGILRRDHYRIAILLSKPLDAIAPPMELVHDVYALMHSAHSGQDGVTQFEISDWPGLYGLRGLASGSGTRAAISSKDQT